MVRNCNPNGFKAVTNLQPVEVGGGGGGRGGGGERTEGICREQEASIP